MFFVIPRVVEWIQSQKCGQVAIRVIRELLSVSGISTLSQASMDSLVKAVKVSCVFLFQGQIEEAVVCVYLVISISTVI